jgi:glycosyltransferase involved in cell wall biosynthesis
MTFLFWLAVLTAVLFAIVAVDTVTGNRSVRSLGEFPPALLPDTPTVSIITAARNEERNIQKALESLLNLAYPNLEVIAVNDRSEDRTGTILDRMAAANDRLNVVHVTELPAGWLGKNHALWWGGGKATGELFLFADADVVMEPTVLARAVRFLLQNRLDHLAVTPRMSMPGTFLSMFGLTFILYFSVFARPWKVRDPASPCHIGIGAFNLIRAEAYREAGGYEKIRLRPDDDMKLGKILKKRGYRSEVLFGPDFLAVEWYGSVREAILGLEKNAFAGCDYRVSVALSGALFLLLGGVFPYVALFITNGVTRGIFGALVIAQVLLLADCARFHRIPSLHAAGLAPCTILFSWIILRTTVLNLLRGGITWRGTFYPLRELRKNVV